MKKTLTSTVLFVAVLGLGVLGCDSDSSSPTEPPPPTEAIFLVDSCPGQEGEAYRIKTSDAAVIAEAERLIATGEQRIPNGRLRSGDGGFNASWSWHIDPATLEFADATIEVCDGCASVVESDVDTWVNNVGSFCPWSAVVLSREQ